MSGNISCKCCVSNLNLEHENYKIPIDSDQYNSIAINISENKGFVTKNNTPTFFRLPAYPLFLGTCYKILGNKPLKTLFVQLIISLLILSLIFMLSYVLLGNILSAKISTIAAALHPGLILFSGMQATESLFLFFFILFFIFFYQGIETNKTLYFCVSGLSLGIASLFRALGHFVIIIAILLIFILLKKSLKKQFLNSIYLLFSWISILGIWIARNYILTGFIFLHTLTGQHFLRYNGVHILMDANQTTWHKPHKELFSMRDRLVKEKEFKTKKQLLEIERDNIAFKLAFKVIFKHPFYAIKDATKQVFLTLFSPYSLMLMQLPPGTIFDKTTTKITKLKKYLVCIKKFPITILFVIWEFFYSIIMLLGVMFFIYFGFKNKGFKKIYIQVLPFILLLVGITLSYGLSRLRLPIEPFIIIISSHGLFLYYKK